MNDLIIMGDFQPCRYLDRYAGCFFDGQASFSFYIFFQGDAFHQFHDDIVDPVFIPHIVYIHDIRMRQSRGSLSLFFEFLHKRVVAPELFFKYFYRHKTIQLMIFSFIYFRHAADADLLQNLISVSHYRPYLNHILTSLLSMVVSNTTCFFVSKYNKNLDFKGNLQ